LAAQGRIANAGKGIFRKFGFDFLLQAFRLFPELNRDISGYLFFSENCGKDHIFLLNPENYYVRLQNFSFGYSCCITKNDVEKTPCPK